MNEIRDFGQTPVFRAWAAALARFGDALHEFSNEPTLVNFERYRCASRRLEAVERRVAGTETAKPLGIDTDRGYPIIAA